MQSIFQATVLLLILALSPLALAIQSIDMKIDNGSDWKAQLRSGQILTTESSDPLHFPTMLGADRFSPFIHLGVIEVDITGGIYVYDTTATIGKYFLTGKSPSDTMKGNVRRMALKDFMSYARVINIYAPPASVNTDKLISILRQHWIAKTPFDPYFNLDDRTALYCSELIAIAMEQSGSTPYTPATMRYNPSLEVIRRWMKISTPEFLFPYQLTKPGNWVGTVSLDYSAQEILIDRLVKYELYQRFTSSQKIGNVMQLDGTKFIIRPAIQRFATQAHNLATDPRFTGASLNELARTVQDIADATLGMNKTQRSTLPRCQLDLRSCTDQ